jgi:hypothetical protein
MKYQDAYIISYDMTTLYQSPEELDLSMSGCSETHIVLTKILHAGDGDKPEITLTTYKDLISTTPQYRVQLFEPSNPSSPSTYQDHDSTISSQTLAFESTSGLAQREAAELVRELEDHFQNLKSEFEEKTGRVWAPLQPWAKDAWGWDGGEEMGDDECGMPG